MDILPHEKQILEYQKTIQQFKDQNQKNPLFSLDELQKLEKKLDKLKEKSLFIPHSMERVLICRHPNRPRSIDYIHHLCEEFFELFGDRTYSDDHAVIGGLATIDGRKFMVIVKKKGRIQRAVSTAILACSIQKGFRKALRLTQMAENLIYL